FSSILLRPTSRRKVSCCVHVAFAEIKRSSQKDILYMSIFLEGFMDNYTLWTKHGEPGVPMEDNEEDNNDDNIPDWTHLYKAGVFEDKSMHEAEANAVEEQQPPDELGQVL